MKFFDLFKNYFQVNYVNLEKIELLRRFKVKESEAKMTDIQYDNYLNNKYGSGKWAKNLINGLLEVRKLHKGKKINLIKNYRLKYIMSYEVSSILVWEGEGGR